MALTTQIGPRVAWEAPRLGGGWEPIVACVDFDAGECGFGVRLASSVTEGEDGTWDGCSLDLASRAHRREARWDFAPSDLGIWLLMLAPISASGTDEAMFYSGHLAAFVILYDRDEDGTYESAGHLWTAAAWRRRGVARSLLLQARVRFSTDRIEGPFTEDGAALLRACPEFRRAS